MLILGSSLLSSPVMSLQTGTQLAQIEQPLIDPANLKIVAYEISGNLLSEHPSFLRTDDIREYGRLGMIIDNNDEIIGLKDVISIEKLYNLKFNLIGLQVIDDKKYKLGRISDYTVDTKDYVIRQLSVKRGLLRGLGDTGLLINRSQIVEINDTTVVVKSTSIKVLEPVMESSRGEFVNPFRGTGQQTKPSTSSISVDS